MPQGRNSKEKIYIICVVYIYIFGKASYVPPQSYLFVGGVGGSFSWGDFENRGGKIFPKLLTLKSDKKFCPNF
jgi:hypothetical protein